MSPSLRNILLSFAALLAVACGACVVALGGVNGDQLRQAQRLADHTYEDDASPPGDRQRARAEYCLIRRALLDNGEPSLDAGPGAACDPEGGR